MQPRTEQDRWASRSQLLAQSLRARPALPASWGNPNVSWTDVDSGIRHPLYSCPFRGCSWYGEDHQNFVNHIDEAHGKEIDIACEPDKNPHGRMDYLHEAIACKERESFPLVGLAVARRSLRDLAQHYNDET